MKALFSLAAEGIKPKLSFDGYSYTLFVPESQEIKPGRNVINTGVLLQLPKKLKACIYPVPEHSISGIYGFDADVLPAIITNGEIVIPLYNRGHSFCLRKGKEIAMLLLNRAYRLEKDRMAFSVNDTLVIDKEKCDKIKASKSGTVTLYTVYFTYRKKKRELIFATKDEIGMSFKVTELKKGSYVIEDGLGLYPKIKKTILEYIAKRKDD